jgi:hypothetical protein
VQISPKLNGRSFRIIDITIEITATRRCVRVTKLGIVKAIKLSGTAKSKDSDFGIILPK